MFKTLKWLPAAILATVTFSGAGSLKAQDIGGTWRGTRSERNAINGGTFTVTFRFEFAQDGTFRETASLGRAVILQLIGRYGLVRARKPGDPTVTHILTLTPQMIEVRAGKDELRLMQMADLPNVSETEQYVTFFNVAPGGGMSLSDKAGGETWGMNRVVQ